MGTAVWGAAPAARAADGPRVLRFGQSAALSGGQAAYGRDVHHGIAAAFAAANASTASTGLRFELTTLDDGGSRARCQQNVQQLVQQPDTLAVIGLTSGAGAEASLPAVGDAQIALLGTASGNMGIRGAQASGAYHVRAGHDVEYGRMAGYIKDFGLAKVAVASLGDISKANLHAMNEALGGLGIKPALSLALDAGASSFADAADELLKARPDCVLFTAHAGPIAKIIDHLHQARYGGLFVATSSAGQELVDILAARRQSCVMSMVVPRPTAVGVSVVSQCQRDLALVPGARMGMTSLEGYIAGRTAVQAALAAYKSGQVSRGRVREVLAGLRADLGGYRVEFAGTPHGSRYVDMIALDRFGRLVG
jgi:ABC-type branched-subunit amino acid transport system substrate-binding protein